MATLLQCPQCGQPLAGTLCAGVCPQCMATSMLGGWGDTSEIEAPPDELIITRVADYDVMRVLGRGGMGVVCRARDRLLGREVALKLMHSGVLASDEELRRFRTEAEAVARLRHPNLVSIYEAGDADGQAFYTMSLAEGGTLAQRLVDQGSMEPRAAAELVECLANAIHHAHTRGVLHRDLKPANIVFDQNDTPMVSDFGLARFTGEGAVSVTDSGSLVGTPAYLAPEVASGAAGHTTSSDVYALGVILYECIAGRTPFENDKPLALLKIITDQDPPALSSLIKSINSDLEAVCMKALAKEPAHRYGSAEALAQDLHHWLHNEPVFARPPLMWERFYRWAQRNQSRAVLYTMAAVSLVILIGASAVMNVILTSEQTRLADAMRRGDMRRAALLRDFASRLLNSPDSIDEARAFLAEATTAGTGSANQDRAITFRLRAIDRLNDAATKPLPHWQGSGLEQVWFDADGHLYGKTRTATFELTQASETTAALAIAPELSAEQSRLSIDGSYVTIVVESANLNPASPPLTHSAPVCAGELSPNALFVATITEDAQLHLWESLTGLPMITDQKLNDAHSHLLWEPKTHQLVVWNAQRLTWYDW